jgi:hypothetical protein
VEEKQEEVVAAMQDELVGIRESTTGKPDEKLHGSEVLLSPEVQQRHKTLRTPLWQYLHNSRPSVALTAPLIYLCFIPFSMLDILITLYQAVSFPIYGIPTVRRKNYLVFDRGKLHYLNGIERINCRYCSYANGLIAYVREIAARTEQHWCPIKHSRPLPKPHARYADFLPYGDAAAYRTRVEEVRSNFGDVKQ